MKLDPQKTALLTLDLQKGVFGLVPDSERVISVAANAHVLSDPALNLNYAMVVHGEQRFAYARPVCADT